MGIYKRKKYVKNHAQNDQEKKKRYEMVKKILKTHKYKTRSYTYSRRSQSCFTFSLCCFFSKQIAKAQPTACDSRSPVSPTARNPWHIHLQNSAYFSRRYFAFFAVVLSIVSWRSGTMLQRGDRGSRLKRWSRSKGKVKFKVTGLRRSRLIF